MYYVIYDTREQRRYYIRREVMHGVDFSRKLSLMYNSDIVVETDRTSGLLVYETPDSTPVSLLKVVKNRYGRSGMLVSPGYIERLLEKVKINYEYGDLGF